MVSRRQVLPVRVRGLELMNRMDGWLVGWLWVPKKLLEGSGISEIHSLGLWNIWAFFFFEV